MRKFILLLFVVVTFGMQAQEQQSWLLNVSELRIKPGHDEQFTQGVEKFKACYQENQGTDKWNIWKRLQGDGNVYVLTSTMENWAEMGEDSEEQADKECRNIVRESIWPHIESSSYSIARYMPDLSKSPSDDTRLVWVTFFDVKNSSDFRETVKEVSSVIREMRGEPMGIWYEYMGGGIGAPDYMVSVPFKNYAELDVERDGPWDMMEKKHGKAKTEEMRNKFRSSMNEAWSYLYTLKEDLSMK